MYAMRRKVADERRKAALTAGAAFAVAAALTVVGLGWMGGVRASKRARLVGIVSSIDVEKASCAKMQATALESMRSAVLTAGASFAKAAVDAKTVSRDDILFVAMTRRKSDGKECERLVKSFEAAERERAKYTDEKQLSGMKLAGNRLAAQIADEMQSVRTKEAESLALELGRLRDAAIATARRASAFGGEAPGIALRFDDLRKRLRSLESSWTGYAEIVSEFNAYTNLLAETRRKMEAAVADANNALAKLESLPFDPQGAIRNHGANLDAKVKAAKTSLLECEEVVSEAAERVADSDKALAKVLAAAASSLAELGNKYGDFLEPAFSNELEAVMAESSEAGKELRNAFEAVHRAFDKSASDVRKAIFDADKWSEDSVSAKDGEAVRRHCDLLRDILGRLECRELEKLAQAAREAAKALLAAKDEAAGRADGVVARARASVPDWKDYARRAESRRRDIVKSAKKAEERLVSISRGVSRYRDRSAGSPNIAYLRNRIDTISKSLREARTKCGEMNAVSISSAGDAALENSKTDMLAEKISKSVNDVDLLECKVREFLSCGKLYNVVYTPWTVDIPNRLDRGERKFGFALDVLSAGRHRVSIRVKKRNGGPLYYAKGAARKVKASVVLSDAYGAVAGGECAFPSDTGKGWKSAITLFDQEIESSAGMRDFVLEFGFKVNGRDDLPGGWWQLGYLDVEFVFDGMPVTTWYLPSASTSYSSP